MPGWMTPDRERQWSTEDFGLEADGIISSALDRAREAVQPAVQTARRAVESFSVPDLASLTAGWVDPPAAPAQQPTADAPPEPQPSWLRNFSVPSLASLTAGWIDPKPATAPSPAASAPAAGTSATGAAAPPFDDTDDDETYIRRAAAARGIDPDTAVMVANTEGGANRGGRARQNLQGAPAYSHFQLYIGGPGNPGLGDAALARGIDPRDPAQWKRAIDFALDDARENGWTAFQGAAGAGIGRWQGIGQGAATSPRQPAAPAANARPTASGAEPLGEGATWTPDQSALEDPDKWSLCGPVAAVAMARSKGGSWTVAQAKALAQKNNLWNAERGMGGLETEATLLRQMGYAAKTAGADWGAIRKDVASGNPVTLSTRWVPEGHYVVLERFDPQTGKYYVGGAGRTLVKTTGRSSWMTPEEIMGLGPIDGALFFDNPGSPTPSVAAEQPESGPNVEDVLAQARGEDAARAGRGVEAPALSLKAPLGEEGGTAPTSGYNDPTAGGTISSPLPQPSYNDPTDGGTLSQPLPPQFTAPTDGGGVYTDETGAPRLAPAGSTVAALPGPSQDDGGGVYVDEAGVVRLRPSAPPVDPSAPVQVPLPNGRSVSVPAGLNTGTPPPAYTPPAPLTDAEIAARQNPVGRAVGGFIDTAIAPHLPEEPIYRPDPEDRRIFMGDQPRTPGQLWEWRGRLAAGAADAIARGIGQDPDTAVVDVTIGGLPVKITVSDLLENFTDPLLGAGFGVGDMVLDAAGRAALRAAAPFARGTAREAIQRVLDSQPVQAAVDAGRRAAESAHEWAQGPGRVIGEALLDLTPMPRVAESTGGGFASGAGRPIRATEAAEVGRLRLDKFPEELRPAIQEAAKRADFGKDVRRGVIDDAGVQRLADDVTRTVDDWISGSKAGRSYNAEEAAALRNLVTGQAEKVTALARELAEAEKAGTVTDLLITRVHHEGERLAALVNVMEGARAEAGRGLRAWRAEGRPTDPTDAAQRIFNKFGGGPEARARAIDAIKEFNQMIADGADPIQLSQFWARVERGGTIRATDVLTAIRYNSMLSSPRTWEIGWVGSILQAPFKIGNDLMAATSRLGSGEIGQAALGSFVGMKRGLRPLWETIAHGITTEQAMGGEIPRGLAARATSPAGKALGTLIDLPGRMVAAPDAMFTQIFRQAELGRQAAIAAFQKGLKGEERAAFIRDFIDQPPTKIDEQVTQAVDKLMLRGDMGHFGQMFASFGKGVPGADLTKSFIIPFMKVAYHVWDQGVELTPAGALWTGVDVARGAAAQALGKEGFGWGPYAKGFGREGAGSYARPLAERLRYNAMGLAVTGWATMNALEGKVSGSGPDDVEKRRMLQDDGWQPYSVKIGDTWVSYANWGPVAVPLASAAAFAESKQYAKPGATSEQQLTDMVARTGKLVTEQTFIKGIGDLMKALDEPDRYGPQVIANMATSMVPFGAGLNTVGQAFDPTRRQPDKAKDIGFSSYIVQSVESRLPFVRAQVPAAQGALGRPSPNEQVGPAAFQPFRFSREKQDATLRAFLDAGVDISQPKTQITVARTPIELTPAEQRRWNELRGAMLSQYTPTIAAHPGYQGSDRLGKERALRRMLDASAEAADRQLMSEIGSPELTRRVREAAQKQRAAS